MVRMIPHIQMQDGEIELHLTPPIPFWRCQPLMIALGIAVLLHLAPFVLFYVPRSTFGHDNLTVFPVTAIADQSAAPATQSTFAQAENERRLRVWSPPHTAYPALPPLIVADNTEFDLPLTQHANAVRWIVSGPLADEDVIGALPVTIAQSPAEDQRYRFAVQLDRQRGQVLWVEVLESASQLAEVEKIVRQIRVPSHTQGGVVKGEIEAWVYANGQRGTL